MFNVVGLENARMAWHSGISSLSLISCAVLDFWQFGGDKAQEGSRDSLVGSFVLEVSQPNLENLVLSYMLICSSKQNLSFD